MSKAAEIHDMDDTALVDHIEKTREELFGLRFQNATGELENTSRVRAVRRDLARGLTVARQRNLQLKVRQKSNA